MRRLPDDIVQPVKDAIAARGQAVFDAARVRIPVRTGELRDSLGIKSANGGMASLVGFGSKEWPALWRKAGWRAKFIEFGTKGSAAHHIPPHPAQPFLRPAFYNDTMKASLQAFRDVVFNTVKGASESS
jgi:HK97 gp10 family phage protein